MIVWLMACGGAPYPDYWSDKAAYPVVTSVEPSLVEGRAGGHRIRLAGKQLSHATTVVIGGRNAEIIHVDDRAIDVVMPELPAGPQDVAVSVVTGEGASTAEGLLTVSTPISDFVNEETASISLLRYDCPIEAWGVYDDGEEYPFGWCGAAMGYASAEAWSGVGPQAGFAAEISGVLPISELPPLGDVRFIGPGHRQPPAVPLVFGAHGASEAFRLQQPRDFVRDVAAVQERRALLEQTYYWAEDITTWQELVVELIDEDECRVASVEVEEVSPGSLLLRDEVGSAGRLTLGFAFEEDYGEFVYSDAAAVTSADVRLDPDDPARVLGDDAVVVMNYDDYSGWFMADNALGPGDLSGGEFSLSTVDGNGRVTQRGYVLGMSPLDLWATFPDLTMGYWPIARSEPLEVTWVPAAETQSPTIVAVEVAVFDMDIRSPNGLTLVGRIIAAALDVDGALVIPKEVLERLPAAPNRWSPQDEPTGYWADMTIARHEIRKVRGASGDTVVDFIHAVNGPVFLE